MEKGPGAGFTKARELFARAAAIQPEFVDILACQAAMDYQEGNLAAAEKSLKALLARDKDNVAAAIDQAFIWIRLGRYAQAEARLRSLIAGAAGNEEARIHLGLGSIHEGRGNDAAAAEEYRQAARSDPESPEPRVALALSLLRGGGAAEARGIAQALLQSQNDNLRIYAVCARILGEAELAAGDLDAALAHYLRAAEAGNGSAAVLERAGILLLRRGKLDAGYTFLKRLLELGGEERPEALNALGYYHYTRGENTAADGYFKKVLAATQSRTAKEKEFAARHAAARAYAQRAQELLADLELLEAWSADFGGPDGQTLNGWTEVERYGVQIARQSNQVILSGTQEREADGLTIATLQRPFDAATFARVTMEGRVASGDARLGLRLTGSARSGATAGLVFYRDLDGLLKFQVQSTQGDWAPGQPTDEKDPKSGKLVYAGTTRWPAGDGFHVLEVRRSKEGARRGTGRTSGFDLLLDGEVVAWNVTVGGLGSKTYELGFSAQTDAVDKNYTAFVKSFKVYRDKPRREIRAKR
jgi:Tfp pilus assembly protein PilF